MKLLRSAVPLVLLASSCTPDQPLELRVYGEEYVEQGIPAADMVDGWSVTFDRFLVSVREAVVAPSSDAAPVGLLEHPVIVDLARDSGGDGHALASGAAALAADASLAYRLAFSADAEPLASMADLDVAPLVDGGCSLFVEGAATRGDEQRAFSWCFASDTTYQGCALALDDGGFDALITVHADHLFYDDLDDDEPNVAFDLIAAADADDDGEVTRAELEATDIGAEERYQVGGRDIDDLWGFLEAQTRTVGHINGEGHCDATE